MAASPSDRYAQQQVATQPRKRGGMSDEDLQAVLRDQLSLAVNYRDTVLVPRRDKVRAHWECDPDLGGALPAKRGRSKYVSPDVRDTVNQIMPDLVDIFLSDDEGVVEFVPAGEEDVVKAQKATRYVNYLVRKHGGLQLFWSAFHDALKNQVGPVRFWWDESKKVTEQKYEGLPFDEFVAITMPDPEMEPDTEVEVVEKEDYSTTAMDPQTGQEVPLVRVNCTIKKTTTVGKVCIAAIPAEERLIDENARSINKGDFTMWAHARNVRVGYLQSLGYDEDELEDLIDGDDFLTNEEAQKRENAGDRTTDEDGSGDPANRKVPYAEVFYYGDLENEGALSLFRICVAGCQAKIMHGGEDNRERVECVNAAEFPSVPVEHTATGTAYAENVVALGGLRTSLWRGMLDSLAQAIFPQRGFHETQVSANDLLNDEPGALVRCKGPPAQLVQEFTHTFTGGDVLAVLQYTDQVKENRTGVSRTSAGLDPNILQSTAKAAAEHTVTASQKQIKLLARIIAEFGMKPLFKGILRLIVEKQRRPEQVRLMNGEWETFDPREWDPDMDCITQVGKGTGSYEEQFQTLQTLLLAQKELAGAKSALVDEAKIYNTLRALVRLTPHRDATIFFNPPMQPGQQQGQQQQPAGPTPEQALADAEKMKAMTERQSAMEKNQNERIKLLLEDDRERDKMEMDLVKSLAVEYMKMGAAVDIGKIKAEAMMLANRERQQYSQLAARAESAPAPGAGAPA